jgi:hypothetical protein
MPGFKSLLHQTVSTTDTDFWNDSCKKMNEQVQRLTAEFELDGYRKAYVGSGDHFARKMSNGMQVSKTDALRRGEVICR